MAEELYNGGPGDPKKGKKVDACADGQCGPTKKAKRNKSVGRFSVTKSRYHLKSTNNSTPSKVDEKATVKFGGSMHQNVRDLGGNPGDPTYNSGSDRNVEERKKAEVTLSKNRRFFKR